MIPVVSILISFGLPVFALYRHGGGEMNTLKHLNSAIAYLEEHLCEDISCKEAARRAGLSEDSFLRFFSYMTGMTVKEYIRRRRLSRAVEELLTGTERIIDLAVKYGYDSADAFSRAMWKPGGEDIRLDDFTTDIDSLDAFEYALERIKDFSGSENSDFPKADKVTVPS